MARCERVPTDAQGNTTETHACGIERVGHNPDTFRAICTCGFRGIATVSKEIAASDLRVHLREHRQ